MFAGCHSNRLRLKVKSPIVNRPYRSSVTDARGAHLRFHGNEPAVRRRPVASIPIPGGCGLRPVKNKGGGF